MATDAGGAKTGSKSREHMKTYFVTGTFHGSVVYARCEGDARRAFHKQYNGESILVVKERGYFVYP
jgi:hypothetical protein